MTDAPVGAVDVSPPKGAAAESTTVKHAVAVADSTERDAEVLVLRESGRSFASIARSLGFDGASPANAAFNRALRRLPPSEQESLPRARDGEAGCLGRTVTQEARSRRSGDGSAGPQSRPAPQEAERLGRAAAGSSSRRCVPFFISL